MKPRLLLDTYVVVRWLVEPKRLSRDQARLLSHAVQLQEQVALSAMTLVEFAILLGGPTASRTVSPMRQAGRLSMRTVVLPSMTTPGP